jgi:hypothetical protein
MSLLKGRLLKGREGHGIHLDEELCVGPTIGFCWTFQWMAEQEHRQFWFVAVASVSKLHQQWEAGLKL